MEHGEGSSQNQFMPIPRSSFRVERSYQNQLRRIPRPNFGNNIGVREEVYLPVTNVTRIMRRVLPRHAKISDDTKEIVQECVTEFIHLVTSEANVRCKSELRKTISTEDVLVAMSHLGFDMYVGLLTTYLNRYRLQGEPIVARMVERVETPVAVPPADGPVFPMGQQPLGAYVVHPEAEAAAMIGGSPPMEVQQPVLNGGSFPTEVERPDNFNYYFGLYP